MTYDEPQNMIAWVKKFKIQFSSVSMRVNGSIYYIEDGCIY